MSLGHDFQDKYWDFDGQAKEQRDMTRQEAAAFYLGVFLNRRILKEWAGVDVEEGRVHRLINGVEVWEEEPTLKVEYRRLLEKVWAWLHRDTRLRQRIEERGFYAFPKKPAKTVQ